MNASRLVAALALSLAFAALACASLVGIDDRELDPGDFETGATVDAGSLPDASRADSSAGDAADAKPSGPTTITCGSVTCTGPGQVCCAYHSSSGSGPEHTFECAATCGPKAGTDRVVSLTCDNTDDCPGGQCCYQQNGTGFRTLCKTQCGFDPSGTNAEVRMCQQGAANQCAVNWRCGDFNISLPNPYGYCRPN